MSEMVEGGKLCFTHLQQSTTAVMLLQPHSEHALLRTWSAVARDFTSDPRMCNQSHLAPYHEGKVRFPHQLIPNPAWLSILLLSSLPLCPPRIVGYIAR